MQFLVTYFPSFQQNMLWVPAFCLQDGRTYCLFSQSTAIEISPPLLTFGVRWSCALLSWLINIQNFRLFNNYVDDFSHVDAWIRTAIRRNAEELDLRVQSSDNSEQFELPKSLFMCKTLMVMKLMTDFVASIPTSHFITLRLTQWKNFYLNALYLKIWPLTLAFQTSFFA